ncbi:MAG: hypothetical protein HY874_04535 [Chloroflexi bacterium]|nr:hypothetical protein [Chloroflexota bacterium]
MVGNSAIVVNSMRESLLASRAGSYLTGAVIPVESCSGAANALTVI